MNNSKLSRRHFLGSTLKTSAVAGAIAANPWNAILAQSRRVNNVGLQVYSLRTEMAQDFEGTLEKLAQLGFKEIEFAGYFDRSPAEVRRILDRLGLTSPAAHIQLTAIRADLERQIETAATIGQKFIVVPSIPADERSLDDYQSHAELLNRAGEASRQAGIKMGYHNHSFEFEQQDGGKIGYDLLLDLTEPDLVAMEMDLYWAVNAKQNPVTWFRNHPGRFAMLHVKDMDRDGNMVDVGRGTIDFAELFSHVEGAGFEHYFIEHDYPTDGINSITYSYNTVSNIRF